MRWLNTALLAVVLCGAALGTARAQQERDETPLFPSQIELVDVDVVVTDKQGNPIKGLTPEDFQIEEDGDPQSIATFDAIEVPDEPVEEVPPRPVVSTNTDEKQETGRTMVVLFDDVHLAPHQAHRAKNAITEFLEQGTRTGDRVTLVASGGGAWWTARMPHGRGELIELLKRLEGRNVSAFQGYDRISDYEALRIHVYRDQQVVERVSRRFETYNVNPSTAFEEGVGGGLYDPVVFNRASDVYYQALSRNRITLEVMERILNSLESTGGRKSLILVSEGFIYDPNIDGFKRVKEASRRSNTAVYFLDTRGLSGLETYYTAEYGPPIDSRDIGAGIFDQLDASGGSESIAIDTGGFVVKNTNDLSKGIQRIVDEQRNYYVLGYHPTNTARDGRFREIKVKVNRKDVEIRARKGYYAPSDEPTALDPKKGGPDPQMQAALDSPYEITDVPLRMTAYVGEETLLGKARTLVAAEVDLREFAFEDRLDVSTGDVSGRRFVNAVEFILVVAHRDTGEYFTINQKVAMKLRQETLDRVGAQWFPLVRDFELQEGWYQAKLVVRDENAKTLGSVVHEFEVPDLSAFRVSTPIITDTLEPQAEGTQAAPEPKMLARREFPAGGMFYVRYDVFGAEKSADDAMPRVLGGFEIRRVDDGTVHTRMEPTLIKPTSLGSLTRFMGLPLAGAAPGDYEFVLTLTDDLSGEKLERREPFTLVEPKETPVHFANIRPGEPLGVTLDKFERLAEGMTYEQVVEILGDDGLEESRNVTGTVTRVVYTWRNANGSHITATFENGALTEKVQVDLPSLAAADLAAGPGSQP